MGIADITHKPSVARTAVAEGSIFMREETLERIRAGEVEKGNPLEAAEIAALQAMKKTSELIPHCHNIPIEGAEFHFTTGSNYVTARCTVKTTAKSGVEMEALVGVTSALNTIWDMVKYLEKQDGIYPKTYITNIRIIEKARGE